MLGDGFCGLPFVRRFIQYQNTGQNEKWQMLHQEKQTLHTTCNFNTVKTAIDISYFEKQETSCNSDFMTCVAIFKCLISLQIRPLLLIPHGRKAMSILTMNKIIDLVILTFLYGLRTKVKRGIKK